MRYLSPNAERVLDWIMTARNVRYAFYDVPGLGLLFLPADVGLAYIKYFNDGYDPKDALVLGAFDAVGAAILGQVGGIAGSTVAAMINSKFGLPGLIIGGELGSSAGGYLSKIIGEELLHSPMNSVKDKFKSACDSFSPGDPLLFDFNGDSVNTVSLNDSKAFFDIDGDGFVEHTEWASGNDGMLAVDANENGLIDDVSELFGNDTAANGIAKFKHSRQVVDQRQAEMLYKAA
ncbi:hypothetical protein [Desulfolutivibrio sulfoxidireducens]|uniref:hypothetical protein n=1 Tax=Desulfolutivibrio sulfoxidireducens TaxID=2773299 RepID=UPI00159E538F|nr:hypothetical protein [Desulfolutivibrio sulfoxidireducens]QLA20971.1 hypothetical protein GD604_15200 [Desulfolutivibrio sulfoxidireducens]